MTSNTYRLPSRMSIRQIGDLQMRPKWRDAPRVRGSVQNAEHRITRPLHSPFADAAA
jgi:hypothetical protein